VTSREPPPGESPRRLLLYAHFDPDDVVHAYVVHALRAMRPVCTETRFVTTSRLPAGERGKVEPHVQAIFEVENVGFDFTMWKRCLETVELASYDEIVLMNSSVYGPLGDIEETFAAMREDPAGAWGIVESLEHDRHLQSFFLVFRRSVLASAAFRTFWDSVLPYRNKRQVIRSYELGLTQWLVDAGFTVAAYCPWRKVVRYLAENPRHAFPLPHALSGIPRLASRLSHFLLRVTGRLYIRPANPTIAFPGELLELGVPFLKLEVLRENPFDRDLDDIRRRVEAMGYPPALLLPPRSAASRDGMRTADQATCPICGEIGPVTYAGRNDASREGSLGCWNIRRCQTPGCGCSWLDPMPIEPDIAKAYAGNAYFTHARAGGRGAPPPRAPGVVGEAIRKAMIVALGLLGLGPRRARFWLHDLGPGEGRRLLEVGCGSGARLADLERAGWVVEGQDVDDAAVATARARGLHVHAGKVEEIDLPMAAYDVVLMSHVLEHLHRPVEVLRRCRALLRPGGRLVLSTPNVSSLGHRLYGPSWIHLDPPRHLVVHGRGSLERVLRQAGFGAVVIRSEPVNAEVTAMHSRDVKYLGWTDWDSVSRLGREKMALAVQLLALILHPVARNSGEEWFVVATKED
jgi:SAM-dependent methyltransferase